MRTKTEDLDLAVEVKVAAAAESGRLDGLKVSEMRCWLGARGERVSRVNKDILKGRLAELLGLQQGH